MRSAYEKLVRFSRVPTYIKAVYMFLILFP